MSPRATCLCHNLHVLLVDAVGLEEGALVVVGLAVAAADGRRHARAGEAAVVDSGPRCWAYRHSIISDPLEARGDLRMTFH